MVTVITSFSKSSVFKTFFFHAKTQTSVFKFLRFEERLRKAPFRDVYIMWTIGLTIETKLRFQTEFLWYTYDAALYWLSFSDAVERGFKKECDNKERTVAEKQIRKWSGKKFVKVRSFTCCSHFLSPPQGSEIYYVTRK